jgi:hypothetical protein
MGDISQSVPQDRVLVGQLFDLLVRLFLGHLQLGDLVLELGQLSGLFA